MQETSTEKQAPDGTIYKDRAMWVGTALGGPLVTGYLVAENYKVFGEKDKIWKTWIVAIAATAMLFFISFYAPYLDRVPNSLFTLVFTGIAYLVVRIWQGAKIDAHIRAGGRVFSWYRVIGVSIAGMLLMAVPFFTFVYLNGGFSYPSTTRTYGNLKHEILFDKNNITEAEVDKIADALTKRDYFTDNAKAYVYVKKIENTYEIYFSCSESVKTEPMAIPFFTALHKELQGLLPENKIVFVLVVGSMDNVIKRIE